MKHITLLTMFLVLSCLSVIRSQQSKNDSLILQRVRHVIAASADYSGVSAAADDAVVTLTGYVRLLSERNALVHEVRKLKGVTRVEDHITLLPANISDEQLALSIKARLDAAGFGSLQFRAHEGAVVVEGVVKDRSQHQRVINIIGSLAGVKETDFNRLKIAEDRSFK